MQKIVSITYQENEVEGTEVIVDSQKVKGQHPGARSQDLEAWSLDLGANLCRRSGAKRIGDFEH